MSNRPETEEQAILSVARKFDPSLSCPGSMDKLSAWRRLCLAVESFMSGGGGGAAPVTIVDAVSGDDATAQRNVPGMPYATIKEAVDQSQPRDYIFIKPGDYNEENTVIPHILTLDFADGSVVQNANPTGDLYTVSGPASLVGTSISGWGVFNVTSDGYVFRASSCLHLFCKFLRQFGTGGAVALSGTADSSKLDFFDAVDIAAGATPAFLFEGDLANVTLRSKRIATNGDSAIRIANNLNVNNGYTIEILEIRATGSACVEIEAVCSVQFINTSITTLDATNANALVDIRSAHASGDVALWFYNCNFQGGAATVEVVQDNSTGGTHQIYIQPDCITTHPFDASLNIVHGSPIVDANWRAFRLQ